MKYKRNIDCGESLNHFRYNFESAKNKEAVIFVSLYF